MKKLELYFSNPTQPELYRMVFQHPLSGAERISIRGKDTGAYLNAYTFQWTQAVKALCVLFLKSAQDSSFVLEGGKGTLASSLDYSIAKNTQWLSDVFGVDVQGKPLVRRLFRRTNSDRAYHGPVGVSLSPMLFDNLQVTVFLDQRELAQSEYFMLSRKIESTSYVDAIIPEQHNLAVPDLRSYFMKIYEKEFRESIFRTEIFTPNSIKNSLLVVKQAGFFKKIAGHELTLAETKLQVQGRLGLGIDYSYTKSTLENLSVLGSSTLIGPVLLFHYLHSKLGIKLNLNFNFPHAVSAVRMILNGEMLDLPDILCAGIAPAATLMGSKYGKDYIPLMFLPDSSQKIVAHKNVLKSKPSLNNACYSYLKEEPSIPAFMLEELQAMGKFAKNKVKLMHNEPDESFCLMQQGDPEFRAAVFFPHYNFNCDFNNCVTLPDPRTRPNSQEVVLLVHRRKASQANFMQTLECLLRDAWLDMRVSPELVKESIESLMEPEGNYFKSIVRFGGLHSLKNGLM